MDCIFCGEKDVVDVLPLSLWGTKPVYHAECAVCGARGQSHFIAEAAAQEWQRLAGYKEALHDILRGPDDTDHVGNWKAMEE